MGPLTETDPGQELETGGRYEALEDAACRLGQHEYFMQTAPSRITESIGGNLLGEPDKDNAQPTYARN